MPWTAPTAAAAVTTRVRLPGSKSITARALVLSALAGGPSTLRLPLRARDTELMAAGLRAIGTHVSTVDDERWLLRPHELRGPAHVDVGLAGTVMRFLPPVAGLVDGPVTFDGDAPARSRPMGPLLTALGRLGVRIDAAPTGGLPLTVHGTGRVPGGEVTIDASASSQLVSALLLSGARFDRGIVLRHQGPPVPSAPHLRMTTHMLRAAGAAVDDATPDVWSVQAGRLSGREWEIEPDLSGALPFFAAAMVTGGQTTLVDWPRRSVQPVGRLQELLGQLGAEVSVDAEGLTVRGTGRLHGIDADLSDVGELTPVLAALAALADSPSRLRGVAHIRAHETDRLQALDEVLTAVGAEVQQLPDGLVITPGPRRPARLDSYADHRMVHAAALLGLAVDGVEVTDPGAVAKTLPDFRERWAGLLGEPVEVPA